MRVSLAPTSTTKVIREKKNNSRGTRTLPDVPFLDDRLISQSLPSANNLSALFFSKDTKTLCLCEYSLNGNYFFLIIFCC